MNVAGAREVPDGHVFLALRNSDTSSGDEMTLTTMSIPAEMPVGALMVLLSMRCRQRMEEVGRTGDRIPPAMEVYLPYIPLRDGVQGDDDRSTTAGETADGLSEAESLADLLPAPTVADEPASSDAPPPPTLVQQPPTVVEVKPPDHLANNPHLFKLTIRDRTVEPIREYEIHFLSVLTMAKLRDYIMETCLQKEKKDWKTLNFTRARKDYPLTNFNKQVKTELDNDDVIILTQRQVGGAPKSKVKTAMFNKRSGQILTRRNELNDLFQKNMPTDIAQLLQSESAKVHSLHQKAIGTALGQGYKVALQTLIRSFPLHSLKSLVEFDASRPEDKMAELSEKLLYAYLPRLPQLLSDLETAKATGLAVVKLIISEVLLKETGHVDWKLLEKLVELDEAQRTPEPLSASSSIPTLPAPAVAMPKASAPYAPDAMPPAPFPAPREGEGDAHMDG